MKREELNQKQIERIVVKNTSNWWNDQKIETAERTDHLRKRVKLNEL